MTTESHHEKPHGRSSGEGRSETTGVTVLSAAGNGFTIAYQTMVGNQPSTYGNTVFIWQSPGIIPYTQPPLSSQAVPGNMQAGSMFCPLQVQMYEYVIGYAVGPSVTDICSYVSVPASGQPPYAVFTTEIQIVYIGPTAVSINYTTPPGNMPQSNGQWVGIWRGVMVPYTMPPLAKIAVNSNLQQGSITLQVEILKGGTYTLGYFMGQKQTTLAASYTFTV